jgi:hypothetical protein
MSIKRGIRIIESFKIVYAEEDDIYICEVYDRTNRNEVLKRFTGTTDSEAELKAIEWINKELETQKRMTKLTIIGSYTFIHFKENDICICELYNDIYCFDLIESFTSATENEAEIEARNSLHSFERERTNEEKERDDLVAKKVANILKNSGKILPRFTEEFYFYGN